MSTKRICRFRFSKKGEPNQLTVWDFDELRVKDGKVVLHNEEFITTLPLPLSEMEHIVISGGLDYTLREQARRWVYFKWSYIKYRIQRRIKRLRGIDDDPLSTRRK